MTPHSHLGMQLNVAGYGAIAPPPAVTNLAITGASGGTVADLTPEATWDAAAGAVTYTLQYGTASDFTGATEVTGIATTSYTIPSDLVDGTTYYFRVAAVNAGGQGPWSDSVSVQVISPYHAAVTALAPDAWWRLDDAAGTTALDSSGNSFNAASTAGVTAQQDPAATNTVKSFAFNGSTNNLAVPYSAGLGTTFNYSGAWFWCAWVYHNGAAVLKRIIDHETAWVVYIQGTTLNHVVYHGTTNAVVTASIAPSGQWLFLAGTISAANVPHVYVANAANDWTVTQSAAGTTGVGSRIADTTNGIGIGGRPATAGRELDGSLDEVFIGSGVPTLAQLQEVVDQARSPFDLTIPGAWTWFSDPRAIAASGSVFVGSINTAGHARVTQFNQSTGERAAGFTLHSSLGVDDHDVPSLLIRSSDSKLMAFYCHHNGAEFYMRVSTNALDASAWDAEVTLDSSLGMDSYTYANPIQLTGETNDPIWLFFRGDPPGATGWAQYFSKSEDDGATWAAATRWIENGSERPYIKLVQNGDARIDFAVTDGHPNSVATNSLYHGYYEGGNWYQSDGTLVGGVGDLPFAPSAFTLVYDGTTTPCWVSDIVIDGSGNPVIAYENFPSTTDHRYRYAKWNGSAWSDNEIVAEGTYLYAAEAYYSGGISIDPADVNTVYLSREPGDADWEIWRYVTSDGGATWEGTKLTTESGRALRPYVVRNHGGDKKVAYFAGTYMTFTNYDTVIKLVGG